MSETWLRRMIAALLLGLGCLSANAQTVDTKSMETYVQEEMSRLQIPGLQLAIVQHGRIVFSAAYGISNVEDSVPVTTKTVFPVNSITKAFTGVAVMELVESAKLDLNTPVSTYLTGLPPAWQRITIRQLMTHTSGLPEIIDDNLKLVDTDGDEAAWKKVQTLPIVAAPGTQFRYTQTNYLLIGKVIEVLTGKPFTEVIKRRQFDVAGLSSTSYGDSLDVTEHVARTYTYLRILGDSVQTTKDLHTRYELNPSFLRTATGIQSTAEDLAKWVIALHQGKFFSKPSSLGILWQPEQLKNGTYGGFSPLLNGYALGWPVAMRAKHRAIGPVGGERAGLFIYPDDDLTVIVLTNLMGASPQAFIDHIAAFYLH
jgi:CubicO group peptidase (beta-lactamase class C family)